MEHLRDFRRGFHLRPLEGFQEARVPCVVSLGNGCRGDFLEDPGAVALPIVPAFEHVGSVRIKVALPLAPGSGIRGHTTRKLASAPFVG